jgi:hypothetical protein
MVLGALTVALLGCKPPQSKKGSQPDAGAPLPSVQCTAQGPYTFVESGITYDNGQPTTEHILAGKSITYQSNGIAVGNIDALQLPASSTNDCDVAPVISTGNASPASLVMSAAAPERALFLLNPAAEAVTMGDLYQVDLTSFPPVLTHVPGSSPQGAINVPSGSFRFGPTGATMLFIDSYDPSSSASSSTGGRGNLEWSDGQHVTLEGALTAPNGIVMSADLSVAVAAINVAYPALTNAPLATQYATGELIAVDMATGVSQVIAGGAGAEFQPTALVTAYGEIPACRPPQLDGSGNPTPGPTCPLPAACASTSGRLPAGCDCALKSAGDAAFSVSTNGHVIAYETSTPTSACDFTYAVSAWVQPDKGSPVTVTFPQAGRFPGVSGSGHLLAFFSDTPPRLNIYDLSAIVQGSTTTPTLVASVDVSATLASGVQTAGFLSPVFTPDELYVAILQNVIVAGSTPNFGNVIGTVGLIPVEQNASLLPYTQNALWNSLWFWPGDPTQKTTQMSLLANLRDKYGGEASAGDPGDLLVDAPDTLYTSATPGASAPVASGISSTSFGRLPASGGFVILSGSGSQTSTTESTAKVWAPDPTPVRRPGQFASMGSQVLGTTLQTSASVASLSGQDDAVWISSDPNLPTQFGSSTTVGVGSSGGGVLPRGDLWGYANGSTNAVQSDVVSATLASDGRVIMIHPVAATGSNTVIDVKPITGAK